MIVVDNHLAPEIEAGLCIRLLGQFVVMADVRDGKIHGLIAFDRITSTDAEMHVLGRAGFLTRGILREAGRLMFGRYGVQRVTAHMRAGNECLHRVAERLGFVQEGLARRYYGDENAVIYGLLREDYAHGHE